MVDLIVSLQERGLTRGVLALKRRRSVVAGETHQFIVPVLGVDETIEALASGAAQVGSLGSATAPSIAALGAGTSEEAEVDAPAPPAEALASSDDLIIDAEIVDDGIDELDKPELVRRLSALGLPTNGDEDALRQRLAEATAPFEAAS